MCLQIRNVHRARRRPRAWTSLARAHSFLYVFRPTTLGRALWAWKFRALPLVRRGLQIATRLVRPPPPAAVEVEP